MSSKIDNLTIAEAREIAALFNQQSALPVLSSCGPHAWEIGKNYLIRTVTMVDSGRLVAVTEHELVLEDAAWIADTGRFSDAVAKAEFGEVEPFPDGRVIIGRGSVIDAVVITKLSRSQK
jgi:hypothetical protein